MAMPSGGQSGVLSGSAPTFGQFRLTTFVDANPKMVGSAPAPRLIPSEVLQEEPASLLPANGSALSSSQALELFEESQDSPAATDEAAIEQDDSTMHDVPPTDPNSHKGFGVLDLTPAPVAREGKLGPHRDGRVRNPIPRKLKGKTNEKSGNFAVMHMDMTGSGGQEIPRGEAAKRTSENTAEAARSANTGGYVSTKRRRIDSAQNTDQEPMIIRTPDRPQSAPQQQIMPRDRDLTPEETKYEQARLLTLLRSINPLTVVNQICTGLAFFGGIPSAPPPRDGNFPLSAEANGPGSLFVGWMSEIFPDLQKKSWKPVSPVKAEQQRPKVEPLKRPRGRPKGSKASKVRKDKGVKKGPKYPAKDGSGIVPNGLLGDLNNGTAQDMGQSADDEDEWIDVTGVGDDFDETQLTIGAPIQHNTRLDGPSSSLGGNIAVGLSDSPSNANGKRGPGRPKGSRNKTREEEHISGDFNMVTPEIEDSDIVGSSTGKKKRGRPPVNKTSVEDPLLASPTQQRPILPPQLSMLASSAPVQTPGLTAQEQAILDAFRAGRAAQASEAAVPTPPKRKRAPKKTVPEGAQLPTGTQPSEGSGIGTGAPTQTMFLQVPLQTPVQAPVKATVQAPVKADIPTKPQQQESAPILPPPKRSRKPKDPNPPTPTSLTNHVHVEPIQPTIISNQINVSQNNTSEHVITPVTSRPPPTGLEAHYEHFASFQQQQQQQQREAQLLQRESGRQQQAQAHLDQNPISINRSSPMQPSAPMQSSTSPYTSYQQQPHHNHPSLPYTPQYNSHQSSNLYQQAAPLPMTDSFRSVNQPHASFSPRTQQQPQQQQQQQPSHASYSHFGDSTSFLDPMESVTNVNGTSGVPVNAYGTGIARSGSGSSAYGGGSQMGGYEGISDAEIQERLMRGIRRR